ncbi:Alkaline phosphatase synthesis sensor protein PhoR [Thalassoglobus polymorphus]|uniref:histidine kinase n=2 Tax=Thalassoglobus polymorphus TaxID=2527994 RepID=A0A517QMT6_9PLAN|nr:Alkaline phosphatase synthesis sensor protein PhoR [Thalassoglobus polymorphus]
MLSSRLFWKIFGTYAALTLVAALSFVAIQSSRQREIVIEQAQQRLHDSAVILRSRMADSFEKGQTAELQQTLVQLGKQNGTRLTLVTEDGTVIGDSAESPEVMDNHNNREELRLARTSGFGVSQRQSPTLDLPMLNYALRVDQGEQVVGFVRVSMTVKALNAQVDSVQRLIWVTAMTVSIVALVLTYFVVGRLIRPLILLTQSAEAIADGDLRQQVVIPSRDELGALAGAFNLMSQKLSMQIDELHQKSAELAKNSERLETVLGGMVEGVIAVDGDERVLFVNQAANSLLEISTPEIVGRPIWEAVRNPAIQKVVKSALESKGQENIELEIPRSEAIVSLLAAQLPGDPCPGVVLVFHDVTDLRRLENIRQEFVSNVSHELKTPLTSIQAYAETLLSGAIDDPDHNRKFLKGIEEQATRLHALILDLLRISRIESGADTFEVSTVPLVETVELCIREHAAICNTKSIQLSMQTHTGEIYVLADPEGLQTILNNLIDNAINYTPSGGQVSVDWAVQNSMVSIKVKDTGIGIPKDHQKRVFERFYRVDKARSREMGGTGLGLSIVKHLAQEFGGEAEVNSEPGQGSTFTVRLPLAQNEKKLGFQKIQAAND